MIKTKPAFPGSEVLEISNKGKIVEMAKILTPPTSFIHSEDKGANSRGKVVFSANSAKVNDNNDHFPINDVDQARNALERASQYTTAPKWYDGPLSEVVAKVKDSVKKNFSSIEVAEELPEIARFFMWDIETIVRVLREVDCIACKEKGFNGLA